MLGNATLQAVVAVKDLEVGKQFYGDTLGLELVEENPMGVSFKSGNGNLFIYESPENAGTNKATHLSWSVDDIEATVAALKEKGVTFEQYDLPGATLEGDIHVFGTEKAAWFKDPDGTILALDSR